MSWLDNLLQKVVQIAGVSLASRQYINFVAGATAVDNPTTGATDITVVGTANTVPTGTGYPHVTGSAYDAASGPILLAGGVTYVSGALPVLNGGLGASNVASTGIPLFTAGVVSILTAPAGALVGTTDAQALTNKTINGASNTLTVRLASDVSGTLPVANGGLGASGAAYTGLQKWAAGVGSAALLLNADVNAAAAIAYSKLGGTSTETINAQQFDTNIDSKGTARTVEPKHVNTTDATVTTADSFTLASNTGVIWQIMVLGVKSDMSLAAAYTRTACFRNNAGTVAQVGATLVGAEFEDDAAWDCTIDNSTTTIRARVTGKAATNITWTILTMRLEGIP